MTLGRDRNPADALLVALGGSIVSLNPWSIRGPEAVAYSGLLLKMQCGNPTISRATHYIGVYELKLQRNIILAETNINTPFSTVPVENTQQTTLVLDETEASNTQVAETTMISSIYDAAHTGGVDTLVNFLEKPTILATGILQTTDVANTNIGTWMLPGALLVKAKQLTKLKGALMFRADFEITLKVNATRFQQGRYLLRWVFFGGAKNSANVEQLAGAHIANLTATTSANRAEIDLATQTSLTVTIPYISASNYSLVDSSDAYRHEICRLYLIPYDPLQAGSGVTTAQFTLWARLTNITISGNVVLQSKSTIRIEQEKGGVGPISGVTSKISKTASIFGSIPVIGSYASSVSWLADAVGSAAKVWGYSKPLTLDPPKTITRRAQPGMANTDHVFAGHKLSAMVVSEVPLSSGRSRTDADEMSFQYLAGHPAWITTVNWPNTATSGTLLLTKAVGLGLDQVAVGKGGVWTPMDYISQMFGAYRGSVKYTFKIPKTEFHSGRLAISFVPWDGNSAVVAPANLGDTDNLFRVIWDVRESNTLEVCIPYTSTRNYTNVGREFGYMYVHVINELMAPSTVPSSVNILVEKSAGDDIEYAFPVRGFHTQDTYPQPYIQFQSASVKLGQNLGGNDMLVAESFGEKVLSVRTLLKRFSTFFIKAGGGFGSIDFYPFETYLAAQTGSLAGPLVRTSMVSDMISYFQPLYAFSSGSVRINVAIDGYTGPSDWGLYNVTSTPTDGVATGASTWIVPQTPVQTIAHGVEGVVSLEVPQYTLFGKRTVGNQIVSSAATYAPMPNYLEGGSFYLLRGVFQKAIDTAVTPLRVHRAAGDDFNLSVFNGVVPTVFNNVA